MNSSIFTKGIVTIMMALILCVVYSSCSNDNDNNVIVPEIIDESKVPEISVPAGSEDFFAKGLDFDSPAAEKKITFTTNVPWTISVSNTNGENDWLSVSPTNGDAGTHNITVKVNANQTYDNRNSVLTISAGDSIRKVFINQKQLDALTLTANRFEVPVMGGTVNVEVKANIDYQVIIPDEYKSWIHIVNNSTRSLSTSFVSFSIDKSEDYDKREGKIIISSKGKEEIVTIYQTGEGILTLTKNEFNLSNSSQEISIEINSNFDYAVEMPAVGWVKEVSSATRGVSSHTLRLKIDKNDEYEKRTAKVRIYDLHSILSEFIIINQEQKNTISLDSKEFEFDERGGQFSVNVSSNVNYNVRINCDWITETTDKTRSLTMISHSFKVSSITENSDREGTITFSDTSTGIKESIVVRQKRAFYFDNTSLTLTEGGQATIKLTNKTDQSVIWASSNTAVATIDNTGQIKAIGKGNAIITAKTSDDQYTCKCNIIVKNITDYISARNIGGSISSFNGLIQYGSILNWRFSNNSSETVKLKTMQLIDGQTGKEGNVMSIEIDVLANSSVSYSTTIGILGIHAPVTCRFKYEYKDKEFSIDAVYSNNW